MISSQDLTHLRDFTLYFWNVFLCVWVECGKKCDTRSFKRKFLEKTTRVPVLRQPHGFKKGINLCEIFQCTFFILFSLYILVLSKIILFIVTGVCGLIMFLRKQKSIPRHQLTRGRNRKTVGMPSPPLPQREEGNMFCTYLDPLARIADKNRLFRLWVRNDV